MPQILNKYSFGADLGTSLGSGIGQGLQYLAQNKINQLTRANEMSQYSNLLQKSGIDSRDADVLAAHFVANPQNFHHILEQYTPRQAISQQAIQQPQYQQGLQHLEQQPQQIQQPAYRQPTPEQAMQLQQLFKGLGQPQQEPSGLGEGVDLLRKSAANELLKTAVGKQPQEEIPAIRQAQQQLQQQVPQAPQQPIVQQPQQPIQFTPNQIEDLHPLIAGKRQKQLEQQEKEQEKIKVKKQQAIDKANSPFLTSLNKAVPVAEEMRSKAQEMIRLLDSGKVTNGLQGVLTPGFLLNEESQQFLANSNDIASLLASNSGVATNFKIKFAQERKPNLSQKPQVQRALAEDLLKQSDKILLRERIANELIAENDNQQPPNLKTQVDAIYNKQKDLPPSYQYSDDAMIEVNGKVYANDNGMWREVQNA